MLGRQIEKNNKIVNVYGEKLKKYCLWINIGFCCNLEFMTSFLQTYLKMGSPLRLWVIQDMEICENKYEMMDNVAVYL